eukprot:TRINITY_DN31859_c0_g1_i1.p1 TRINITY_DN31859_c0_g1~~TRINITY_DN31859_c0_g1_i1.p1  ORF type:complete len:631 (+),score=77.75 TRINITY_DN31859_c0_g1_i1:72-1895(+)
MVSGCTDSSWIFGFIVALGGLLIILAHALQYGDYGRLFHAYDYRGLRCGVDVAEQYLYYCQDASSDLIWGFNMDAGNYGHPICVANCPTSSGTARDCPGGGLASRPVAGRFCLPVMRPQAEQVVSIILASDGFVFTEQFAQLPHAWPALCLSAIVAIVLSYIYLFTLRMCAFPLVCICISLIVSCPAAIGAYLISVAGSFEGGVDWLPSSDSETKNIVAGCVCFGIGSLLAVLACCSLRGIGTAIGCVKVACECIFECRILLLSPVIELMSKATALIAMFAGLLLLLSCGRVTNVMWTYRSEYTGMQYVCMAYWCLMMIWVCEFFTSLSQFAIAHSVQRWYFAPNTNRLRSRAAWFSLLRGYRVGLTFHLGSLFFGSLMMATFRIVRMSLGWLVTSCHAQRTEDETGVVKVLQRTIDCVRWIVQIANKNAYIEMAVGSSSLAASAQIAFTTVTTQVAAVTLLHGATWIFQFVGVAAVSCAGAYITLLTCRCSPVFNDATSDHFVSDPIFVSGAAALICAIVGVSFVTVFDTVADAVLYCFAKEKLRNEASVGVGDSDVTRHETRQASEVVGRYQRRSLQNDALESHADLEGHVFAPPQLRQLLAENR